MTAEGTAAVNRANRALVSALVLVLVLSVVAPFAVFGVPQLIGADRSYVVLSGSMEPYMSAGDAVIVAAGPAASIREGDVITYQRGGDIPTTHRVIERVTDEQGVAFRTMGDANEDPDPALVRPGSVVGEVVLVIPYIGYVVQFANTPIGIASLVVVPIGLLVISELWRYVASRRRRKAPTAPRPAVRRVAEAEPADEADDSREPTPRPRATSQATTADTAPEPRRTAPAPRSATASGPASDGASQPVYGVKTLDLGLTFLVLVVLAAYSGWMLYNEIRVESAMVLAGAVMALLLLAATWLLAARAARGGRRETAVNSSTTDRPGGTSAPPLRPGSERGQETTDD
ncbi:signal peptidase I [Haloglomus litoreum]|uniref:signal peptidase I n=1 Tax=Haloglomus litoreum TaxID=3034026 RepID=UPI0023E8BBEE|nr:signal peptidase I [Haloglomus sp. DT116]